MGDYMKNLIDEELKECFKILDEYKKEGIQIRKSNEHFISFSPNDNLQEKIRKCEIQNKAKHMEQILSLINLLEQQMEQYK